MFKLSYNRLLHIYGSDKRRESDQYTVMTLMSAVTLEKGLLLNLVLSSSIYK